MTTAGVAGPGPVVEPTADQEWREACARASVILGVIGLAVLALVLLANLTFLMDGVPVVARQFRNEGGGVLAYGLGSIVVLTGVVTGFLGRRSRRRRTAVVGSWLSGVAFVGLAAAGFSLPYFTYVRALAWSPDGTQIAYAQNEAGVWVVSADGSSEPTQLAADGSATVWSTVWSPDGSTIAYTASGKNWQTEIWAARADGSSEPTQLADDGSAPAWSPDGSTIAYVATVVFDQDARGVLWLMDADGGNPRQLVQLLSTQEQEVGSPAWSPDGTQIAFDGAPLGEGTQSIWVVDVDGENLRQVTTEGSAPAWSPDGRQIAYVGPSSTGWGTLWVTNVDGSGGTLLSSDTWGIPQWMPDGRVAFNCPEGLCVVDALGTDRQVLLAGDEGKPLAIESARVISPDGSQVTYATGAGRRTDIVVHTIDGSTQNTLIH